MKTEQEIQEVSYGFPYHYIPEQSSKGLSQVRSFSWAFEYLSYLAFVEELVVALRPQNMLDVGCGDGRFVNSLARNQDVIQVLGIDYSRRAIDLARAMGPSSARFEIGRIEDNCLKGNQFELITLIEVLEHIPPNEIDDFTKSIHQLLSENGKFIVTVPSANVPLQAKHFQHFSEQSLRGVLETRFTVTDCFYLNSNSIGWRLIRKLLCNSLFAITSPYVTGRLFAAYKRKGARSSPDRCRRLCVVCEKR